MTRGTILLVAAVLAFLPPSSTFGAAALSLAAAPKVHTVVMDKMKFGPLPKEIRPGDTILWVNRDIFRHTATARDGSFAIDLPAGKSGRTVVKRAGTIPFYCKYHPGMKGQLVVAK